LRRAEMDFRFTAEEEAFRREVHEFLEQELSKPEYQTWGPSRQFRPEFTRMLAQMGWLGVGWPKEYGGLGRPYMQQLIYGEEIMYHRAPTGANVLGQNMVGPALIQVGSDEHKMEFLPRILRGEVVFCLGYTEPGAGSDLAALQTQARAEGDCYVITGQKTLISMAKQADYCWLGARTDPNAPKHRGISLFIVDMKTPGITVRPIETMADMEIYEVFFDDVRVPRSALVGEANRGWYYIATALDHERVFMGAAIAGHRRTFEDLVEYAKETRHNGKPLSSGPIIRQKLAQLAVELEVGRMLGYRVAWVLSKGVVPYHEASVAKVFTSELERQLTNVGMQIMGLVGLLKEGSRWAPLKGYMEWAYRMSILCAIGGGANEIQRNIIALVGLGLPR